MELMCVDKVVKMILLDFGISGIKCLMRSVGLIELMWKVVVIVLVVSIFKDFFGFVLLIFNIFVVLMMSENFWLFLVRFFVFF